MATATAMKHTIGVFKTREAAEQAVADLRAAGYRNDQIGVVGMDSSGKTVRTDGAGDNAGEGMAIGAAAGATTGALVGLGILSGVIPVIGPALVAGTLGTILTNAVGFVGTWLLTILMSFAGLWLFCWEYDRLKPIFFQTRAQATRRFRLEFLAVPGLFVIGGVAMGALWWTIRLGNFSNYGSVTAILAAMGFVFGIVVTLHYRLMPVGALRRDLS